MLLPGRNSDVPLAADDQLCDFGYLPGWRRSLPDGEKAVKVAEIIRASKPDLARERLASVTPVTSSIIREGAAGAGAEPSGDLLGPEWQIAVLMVGHRGTVNRRCSAAGGLDAKFESGLRA